MPVKTVLRLSVLAVAVSVTARVAQLNAAPAADGCGEVVTIETHGRTTTRYAFASPRQLPAQSTRIAVVLLVGAEVILTSITRAVRAS